MATEERLREVAALLQRIVDWAAQRDDVRALALVGSWARGEPCDVSDLDLVLLTHAPAAYVTSVDWIAEIEAARLVRTQAWGVVTERRFVLVNGLEIEFGITSPAWAAVDPIDAGTRRVATDGMRTLYDPDALLATLTECLTDNLTLEQRRVDRRHVPPR